MTRVAVVGAGMAWPAAAAPEGMRVALELQATTISMKTVFVSSAHQRSTG